MLLTPISDLGSREIERPDSTLFSFKFGTGFAYTIKETTKCEGGVADRARTLEGGNDRGLANRGERVGLNCQVIKYLAVWF